MHAIILAGGSGVHFWPLSRTNNPKQLHPLISDKPMIQESADRLSSVVSSENIWVVTSGNYIYRTRQHLKSVPPKHVIGEPYALGTTLAISLAMLKISRIDPQVTVIVEWSDSHVGNPNAYVEAIRVAEEAAHTADGVIIGVKPILPLTDYGYIKMGRPLPDAQNGDAFWINEFIQKPDKDRAKQFIQRWEYLWNTGISVWRVDKFLSLLERLRPAEFEAMKKIEPFLDMPEESNAIENELKDIPKLAVDYSLFEKADHLAVVPADLNWSDIGNWDTLKEMLPVTDGTNVIRGRDVLTLDTENSLIFGDDRLVAVLGVRDMIIVDTNDCLLVARRDQAQQVKELVERLKLKYKGRYV